MLPAETKGGGDGIGRAAIEGGRNRSCCCVYEFRVRVQWPIEIDLWWSMDSGGAVGTGIAITIWEESRIPVC